MLCYVFYHCFYHCFGGSGKGRSLQGAIKNGTYFFSYWKMGQANSMPLNRISVCSGAYLLLFNAFTPRLSNEWKNKLGKDSEPALLPVEVLMRARGWVYRWNKMKFIFKILIQVYSSKTIKKIRIFTISTNNSEDLKTQLKKITLCQCFPKKVWNIHIWLGFWFFFNIFQNYEVSENVIWIFFNR